MNMNNTHGNRAGALLLATVTMMAGLGIGAAAGIGVGTANAASTATGESAKVEINEVFAGNTKAADDADDKRCDWVELKNTTSGDVDVKGWGIYDSGKKAKKHYTIGTSAVVVTDTVIKAGGYLVVYIDPDTAEPGLGSDADSVYLTTSSGDFVDADVVDSTIWDASTTGVSEMSDTQSWARQADGSFALSDTPTPGKANPGQSDGSDSDDDGTIADNDGVADSTTGLYLKSINIATDVVTIASGASGNTDISGWTIRDNKDTADHIYTIGQGSVIAAGGETSIDLSVPGIGLGKDDSVRVFDASGRQVLKFAWTTTNSGAVFTINDKHSDMSEQGASNTEESTDNIIKDSATAIFLKSIDVGSDTVILGSKAKTDTSLAAWTLRDSDDSHIYSFADDAVIKAGSQISTGTLPFGLGKSDKVRVYNASGTLVLQFSWSGDDGDVVYVANTDADGMDIQGDGAVTPTPSDDAMTVSKWAGLSTVSTLDQENSFGAVSSDGEHTDGNLSGLVYENASKTLWGADNDLNPTLGITGPKGAGSINKFVSDGSGLKQDSSDGWSFTLDGISKGGKQLHFKDGTGGVDAEGITLINNSSDSGIFIGAERDNENKKVPRPSILKYDAKSTTTDTNGDGAQDMTASQEWNLSSELATAGLTFAEGDDANLGVEGVAYVPDSYLTAHGFTTRDGGVYRPADYKNSYAGLFLAAIEKNGHIYAFALADDGTVTLVQDISLPQAAINAGYSGPRDLTWDGEHQQLLAQGDNDSGSGAMIATYTLSGTGFALTSLMATPAEIAGQNTEGFAITPDAQCASVAGGATGKRYKPVYWSDDGVSQGHSLRTGYMLCGDGTQTQSQTGQQGAATGSTTGNAGTSGTTTSDSTGKGLLATTGSDLAEASILAGVLVALAVTLMALRGGIRLRASNDSSAKDSSINV
ncbi:MAG: lamin tail domain-containing protein [Bifidobacterium psychraerophilum]|uniref:lamin tail domain-containing protein n=1 Tax=Bifidobacterium psychraerophilum TaxID=218140 RepID=UPI0039EB71A4